MRDVVIVGGGSAGLSAAVTLGRSLRTVVVIDAGDPRNAPAASVHNILAREGISPGELLAAGREEAEHYGVEVIADRVVSAASRSDGGFDLRTATGRDIRARRILLATGLTDELPEVPGVRELWGQSVLHCPYCHGWEVRGRRIGVLATTERSVHQALLFRQLSSDVTFFSHTLRLDGGSAEKLAARGIRAISGVVQRLLLDDGLLRAVRLGDGRDFPVDAVAVAPRFIARAAMYEELGGVLTEHPLGTYIKTDQTGRTDVPGVFAAGNVSDLAEMVAGAMGSGVMVAAAINADLVDNDVRRADRESRA